MLLFHGSPLGDQKILTPMTGQKPHYMSVRPRVWASPDIKTAIVHSRDWHDPDVGFGTFNGVHYLEERRPGALSLFDGPGHLYGVVNSKSFKQLIKDGRPSPREYYSEKAVPVVHLLLIPNVLDLLRAIRMKIVPYGMKASYLGEETLIHYSREPYKTLRPLTYEELVKDRTQGRWENKPDMAKKYVESRKRYEGAFRTVLKNAGLPYDPKKSFLYYTILGKHLLEWAKGRYEHRIPLSPEVIRETFFDVVGLPREAGRIPPPKNLFADKGLERALRLWKEYKDKVKTYKYMGMTIFPRIEVLTQKEFTPEIWKDNERVTSL